MPRKLRMRLLVSIALWGAIAYYFLAAFRQVDWNVVTTLTLSPVPAIAAVVIGVGSRFLLPLIWTMALSALEGRAMSVRTLIWPYAVSWMGRYIPGKVGMLGARMLAAERYGYSKVSVIISAGMEVVLQLVLVTALSFLGLGLGSRLNFNPIPVLLVVGILAILISPPVLRRMVTLYLRWQGKANESVQSLSWSTVLGCATVFLLMYGLQSTYSILLAESMGMAVYGQWLMFLGAIFLSSIAGMVAFFTPGGIGVRELVFVQVLGGWHSKEQLLAFAIVWRLAETLMDAVFFAIASFLKQDVS